MRISKVAARKAKLLLLQPYHPQLAEVIDDIDPRPEMLCFRRQTLALVRHFFELSSQVGRVPSLLGREFFRARVSHHAIPSFEEQVIFVCDIELCLGRLSEDHAQIVTLVGLYDFSHDEVAEMLHRSRASVRHWFAEALDCLSEIFLQAQFLSAERPDRRQKQVFSGNLPADIAALGRKPPTSVTLVPGCKTAVPGYGEAGFDRRSRSA